MNPSSVIIGSVIIITSTTIIRRVRKKQSEGNVIETIIFGFLLLIALLVLALVMPEFAKVLAYLGIIGAFIVNGPEVLAILGNFGR